MDSNPLRALRKLIGTDPLRIGQSDGPVGDGTTWVDMLDGGRVRCTGDAAAGQMVFVKGSQIVGDAPALTPVNIDV